MIFIAAVIVAYALRYLVASSSGAQRRGAATSFSTSTTTTATSPCKYVYVDLGTNVGVQVRKLFEPHKYPDAPSVKVFEKYFGPATPERNAVTCVVGVEANPNHAAKLQQMEKCYNRMGWRTKIYVPRVVATTSEGE